jgi:predicted ATPase/class 3 adenylate cyclase/DNA-binding CsgD family transcriptional regulator
MRDFFLMGTDTDRPFTLPTGTVAFLLTDIEGSSARWDADPAAMAPAVTRHYAILDEAVARHGGVRPVEQGEGDSIVAAFSRATDAIAAALDAQRELLAVVGDCFVVRMAVHAGEAQLRDEGNYFGQTVIRCARLRALGHGGQVLVSRTAADLSLDALPDGAELLDLGEVRLRDLGRREHVFQLRHADLPDEFPSLRSPDSVANNLPTPLTSLVGREDELVQLTELVGEHRLVTLAGIGGAGKTRLALQLGADVLDRFPDGVWWAELAPLASGDEVGAAVARACGATEVAGASVGDAIAARLADRDTLIVLDNCEHVLDGSSDLVNTLLLRCPRVHVVTTSREPLGVPGEVVWRAPSLALPPVGRPATPQSLGAYDAVRLFVERARLARPNFAITNDNAPAVAEICQRLDGIPLAIELAASRVRQMPPERIASGIDDRFRLLTGGARTVMPRQQTLEASIEWSHDLLDDAERTVLHRLGVFVGGFSSDAAEHVVAASSDLDPYDVFDVLGRLVDKSLVIADESGRYRLLETVRSFTLARARQLGSVEAIRDAHLSWAFATVDRWGLHREFPSEAVDAEMIAELANLAAALGWSMQPGRDLAVALLRPLTRGWYETSAYSEVLAWSARLLDATVDDERNRFYVAAELAVIVAFAGSVSLLGPAAEAWDAAERTGDAYLLSRACRSFGVGANFGDATSLARVEAGVAAAAAIGDQFGVFELTSSLATAYVSAGRIDLAIDALDRCASLATWSHPMMTMHRAMRGFIAYYTGDRRAALDTALAERPGTLPAHGYLVHLGTISALAMGDRDAIERFRRQAHDLPTLGTPGVARNTALAAIAVYLDEPDADESLAFMFSGVRLGAASMMFGLLIAAWRVSRSADEILRRQVLELTATATRDAPIVVLNTALVRLLADPSVDRWETAHDVLRRASVHGMRLYFELPLEFIAEVELDVGNRAVGLALLGAVERERAIRTDLTGMGGRRPIVERLIAEHGPLPETRLTLDEAVALAQRSRGERRRPSHGWASLTPAEIDVARLVAEGLTNPAIAKRLVMSPNTVKTHLSHIFAKLDIGNRAELAHLVAVAPT